MRKKTDFPKTIIKKVFTTLFLSVLVFHINSSVVLALTPTPSKGGSVTPLPLIYGNDQEAQLQVQSVNYPTPNSSYTTFNPTPNSNLSSKKVGFFSKFKNKFNSTVNFTYSKVSSGVKSVGFWFSNTRNSFNSHPFTYLSFTGLATLAGSYLISKNRAWISKRFYSAQNFLKQKLGTKTLSLLSKTKSFLTPLANSFKDSIRSTSKTLLSSLIPVSTILALQNSSLVRNTRLFRETLATNLSSQLSNWKNATLFPWIQEKTKNKGMAMAIVGIQTTFIVSVGISLLDIGPSVAALALTPEKTISTTINLGVNITKAEVNYTKQVFQNPSKLVEDVKAVPSVAKSLTTHTVTQAKDFYHTDSYHKADKLGVVTAQALDLVVGSHGVGKLSKVTKTEDVITDIKKIEKVITEVNTADNVFINQTDLAKIWNSEDKFKSSTKSALQHWYKHKSEFPELNNAKEYVEASHDFVNRSPEGTLYRALDRGREAFYNPNSNTLVITQKGLPSTMYKPLNGLDNFNNLK